MQQSKQFSELFLLAPISWETLQGIISCVNFYFFVVKCGNTNFHNSKT